MGPLGKRLAHSILYCIALVGSCTTATVAAPAPKVVVSIAPLHSLTTALMDGVGEPWLLVKGGASPHAYSMRPSDARALDAADLVVWVGAALEAFLARPLEALAGRARIVGIAGLEAITLLESREGGTWEDHGGETVGREHGQEQGHGHGGHDLHVWLDPRNAATIVQALAGELSDVDPGNAARYQANGDALLERLRALEAELEARLAVVRDKPYVVFHDAYQYFERRFGLSPAGAITVSPERQVGARRISELRARIRALGAACVFSEPQFEPALVASLLEGSSAKSGILDPLGATIAPGPEAYFTLLRDLAGSLADCLAPPS